MFYVITHTLINNRASSSVYGVTCLFAKKFSKSLNDQIAADFEVSTPVPLEMMLAAAIASNKRFFCNKVLVFCELFGPPFLLIVFEPIKKKKKIGKCF